MQGERTVATPKTDNSLPYLVRSRHSHLPQLIPPGLFSRHFQSALQAVRWFAEYEAHPEQREAVVGKFQVRRPSRARGQAPPSRRKPSPPLRCTIAAMRVALLCTDGPIPLYARPPSFHLRHLFKRLPRPPAPPSKPWQRLSSLKRDLSRMPLGPCIEAPPSNSRKGGKKGGRAEGREGGTSDVGRN